ncbi:MAG TPA: polysaccharide biosynthesis protein [Candidatus Angelobacter sp.]|nr:polysaccharide biosynthesis protein [Candidatus Angelobacter sp.]
MFAGKIYLITGGTGSWGYELTRQLLQHNPKQIRIFSRNEFAQVQMQRAFHADSRLQFRIGDVRDLNALQAACMGVDCVFHLAALKHVPICEAQPEEALKTNVHGTSNLITASLAAGVEKVIDVSSDKACDPINLYGMTKAIGEKLMIHANQPDRKTRFVCVRGGNVLGTNGSVVPFFRQQLQTSGEITLTHGEMTRFFLTLPQAIGLLLEAHRVSIGGETFVMKMKACNIRDLADVMSRALIGKPARCREIGIRPGEKLHEVLVSRHESRNTYRYSEQYFAILPPHASPELNARYASLPHVPFTEYHSNADLMAPEDIDCLLREGGFLS